MTNDIAIQLLFDRINVLGKQIGGFIIKDRQKFEKAVAKMMYEEILNTETLREILNNENTYNLIYKFLKELIDEQIVNNIDDKCIGNIPGFERFVESLQMNASKVTEYSEIIDLRNLLEKINTSEFLSEEQFQHIVSKINILINETDFIKSIQKNIAYHIAQKNFTDFFSEKLIDNLFDGLIKKLSPLIQDDALHDTIIRNSKYSIYTLVEESFIKYLKLIKDNTLLEILGEERLKKLVTITQDYMGQLFKNKCVVKHLECLIFELANELQKNKTPIRSLIGPNIIDECKKTIYSLLPLLLTTLREFIETTSDNITGFVHKKIEQAIKQSGSSVTKIDTIADKVYKSFQEYDFCLLYTSDAADD